jgi:hypothetical protein
MSGAQPKSGPADPHSDPDEKTDAAALTGLAGAAGRDQYVGAQLSQAERSARAQPSTAFDGEVYRALGSKLTATVADHSWSKAGRYNAPGQTAFYAAPSLEAVKAEASNYQGLDGNTVVRGSFQGKLLDLRATPGVSASALMQPYGGNGRLRSTLSTLTGEDAYTLPRALGDVARERDLGGVIAPANGRSTNLALFPDRPDRPLSGPGRFEAGYRPVEYTRFEATGPVSTDRLNTPHASVPDTKPNTFSPPGVDQYGNTRGFERYAVEVRMDAKLHSRAGGERYGAVGAGLVGLAEGVASGHLDGGKLATDVSLGAVSARAETSLAHRLETMLSPAPVPPNVAGVSTGLEVNTAARAAMRPPGLVAGAGAAGVVGAVVGAGATAWQDADAVRLHQLSAGRATADVAVQAGIGLGAGAAGAATGAAVGSVVPVAGTAVGAAVGFGVGIGVGYVAQHAAPIHAAQEAVGDILTRHFEKPLQRAWDGVASVVDGVRSAPARALDATEHAASAALSAAESMGRHVVDSPGGSPVSHPSAAGDAQGQPPRHEVGQDRQADAQAFRRRSAALSTSAARPERPPAGDVHAAGQAYWTRVAASAPAPAAAQSSEQVPQQGIRLRQ